MTEAEMTAGVGEWGRGVATGKGREIGRCWVVEGPRD